MTLMTANFSNISLFKNFYILFVLLAIIRPIRKNNERKS